MNISLLLAVLAAAMVSFIAVAIPVVATRRENRRRREEEIRERAQQEQVAERQRVKKVKRLARQDKLGDQIFWSLHGSWKKAGRPSDLEPRRIRHNFGSAEDGGYYIEVGGDGRDPIKTKVWLTLDLCRPNRELSVTGDSYLLGGVGHREFPASDGTGFICSVLADQLFSKKLS